MQPYFLFIVYLGRAWTGAFERMILFVISILVFIYIFSIPVFGKLRIGPRGARILRLSIIGTTGILVAVLIARRYNTYPGEYWATKIIFWVPVFLSMAAFGLCRREHFGTFERKVYKLAFYSPILFLLFLLVPFIGAGSGLAFYVNFIGDSKFILYNDDDIRIEQPYIRFLGPDPQPVVYILDGLMASKDTSLPFRYRVENDTLKVIKQNDTTFLVVHISPDNWQVPDGIDSFIYKLKAR